MTLTEFTGIWEEIEEGKSVSIQRRVNSMHPLNIFFGYDSIGKREFIVVTEIKPELKLKSAAIDIKIGSRKDNRFAVCFKLVEKRQEAVFVKLCWDLFEFTSDSLNELDGINKIQNRFRIWQKLFDEGNDGLLSEQVIKGLIGELIFLKNYAFKQYGVEDAVNSWIGPYYSHKDFSFETNWYEIKTIAPSARSITISSLEQLASEETGYIYCMVIDKTSSTAADRINLPSLINRIRNIADANESAGIEFENKLIEAGYIDTDEYYNYNYSFVECRKYIIDNKFPKLTGDNVDDAITEVKYKINLSSIGNWLVE